MDWACKMYGDRIGACKVLVGRRHGKKQLERPRRRWEEDINLLTPNVNYSGRTAPLTSKVAFYIFFQQI